MADESSRRTMRETSDDTTTFGARPVRMAVVNQAEITRGAQPTTDTPKPPNPPKGESGVTASPDGRK
jgi:hypothetical protein